MLIGLAPEGRAVDAVVLPLEQASPGMTFSGFLAAYLAFVSGRIVGGAAAA